MRSYADLWNNTVLRMLGQEVAPVAEPEPGDNRFKDPEWSANPYFDFWKQAYLVTARWARNADADEGLDEARAKRPSSICARSRARSRPPTSP